MPRTWFRAPAALVLGFVISGCTAAAVPNASPSEPGGQAATTAPSPVVTSPSATSPAPSATHLPARTDPPSPTPFAILDGEPWLLLNAFVANDRKAAYLVRPDGSSLPRILTGLAADVRDSSWSPDGQHIVFSVRDSSTPDGSIWTADGDGSNPKLLYDGRKDGCGAVWDGVWSPDGTRISLICYRGAAGTPETPNAALHSVLAVKRRPLETVATTRWPDFLDNPASWSPDGRTLAFDILHWDPTNAFIDGSRIATAGADGSKKPKELDTNTSFAAYPDWTADGTRLIYNTRDLGEGPHDGA